MPPQTEPSLEEYRNRRIVLDTQGPLLYIGRLLAWSDIAFWLGDADVHDCTDGHASKEEYVNEACQLARQGSHHVNRRRVFVERRAIVSLSALDEVVTGPFEESE